MVSRWNRGEILFIVFAVAAHIPSCVRGIGNHNYVLQTTFSPINDTRGQRVKPYSRRE